MNSERATFSSGGLKLEGIWHPPQGKGSFPAVVVCHPHPLFGGDMFNNVVLAICQELSRNSIGALCFNFRGVGQSQGAFANGIGEQEDVKSALDFLTSIEQVDREKIGLAGYSFGASVALPVALQNDSVQALALVSPPLSPQDWVKLKNYPKPKLLLCGSDDPFVSSAEFERYSQELAEPKQYEVIPDADHFWWGYEPRLGEKVATFFSEALKIIDI
jgi:hypothetical protein